MTETQALDWEGKYQAGTAPWERPAPHPAFLAWHAEGLFAPPVRVLIPGAGRSAEPAELAALGCDVTVVDAAPSAVAAQRGLLAGFPAARAEQADLFAWAPAARFDAIYDQTCLCALPPVLWPDYADRLAGWLRPGGRLFVLFMQTGQEGGPPFDCEIGAMRRLFAPERWDWPATLGPTVPHPSLRGEQPAVLIRR